MSAEQWVVRLRVARTCWTSSVMTGQEADSYREGLRAQILAAGDSPRMVDFVGLGGRHVSVRARDVVAVETSRWIDHEQPAGDEQPRGATLGGYIAPPADGTRFLQQVAGVDEAMARHPAGSRKPVIR